MVLKKKKNVIKEVHFLDFYNSLVEGDKVHCSEITKELLSQKVDIIDVYSDLFQRALYHIGKLWDKGRLSIAEEHAASQIIIELVHSIQPKKTVKKKYIRSAVISCIDKEHHEIGARMVANTFEFNGWNAKFLGASVPSKDIIRFIKTNQPKIVGLSFNLYLNLIRFYTLVEHIKKFFPQQKIIFGGQAAKQEKKNIVARFPDLLFFDSLQELDNYLKAN